MGSTRENPQDGHGGLRSPLRPLGPLADANVLNSLDMPTQKRAMPVLSRVCRTHQAALKIETSATSCTPEDQVVGASLLVVSLGSSGQPDLAPGVCLRTDRFARVLVGLANCEKTVPWRLFTAMMRRGSLFGVPFVGGTLFGLVLKGS